MKVLIIEDELLSAQQLRRYLMQLVPACTILDIIDTVHDAVGFLQHQSMPDLIFMDVHLADGICFEIFQQTQPPVPVIFTTAYDQYAIQAFQVHSIDYLLKPISPEKLQKALDKLQNWQALTLQHLHSLQREIMLTEKKYKQFFMVKSGQTIHQLAIRDICYFYSQDSITFLVLNNSKRYPLPHTLEQLEEMIAPELFFRINRKVLIQRSIATVVQTYANSRLQIVYPGLIDDKSIVSRERVSAFKSWLAE